MVLLLTLSFAFAEGSVDKIGSKGSVCKEITQLQKTLQNSSEPDKVLFEMGKLSNEKREISLEQYKGNSDYKKICHLKSVKSANFGDFVSYDGYHFQKIIEKYPQSNLADDAAYALIYVITDDVYNYDDAKAERKKLLQFIKKYPKSNLADIAKKRVKSIDEDIKNGVPTIMD